MSGALEAVQPMLVTALHDHAALANALTGIYDGPPARAAFPYLALTTGAAIDWSHKNGRGRELRLAFAIHDDGASAARLHRLMALAEEALAGGLADPPDWQVVTFNFLRARVLRNADAPWSGLIEYRARVLEK